MHLVVAANDHGDINAVLTGRLIASNDGAAGPLVDLVAEERDAGILGGQLLDHIGELGVGLASSTT